MKFKWIQFLRYPHQSALPTITTDHRGQVRMLTGDASTTDDELYLGAHDAATLEWRKLAIAEDVTAEITARGIHATFGPFFANDLAATATVDLQAAFFDTATTVSRSTPDVYMPVAGEIVGIFAITDANRTSGTATVNPMVGGVAQTFNGGAVCAIDATNTRRHSILAAKGNGESFTSGGRISLQVVTSGWGPTTANMTAWVTVRFDL